MTELKIIRSSRRKKTISAREVNGVIHLYLPAGLSREKELSYVAWAKRRIEAQQRKKALMENQADQELEKRAHELNQRYFGGALAWQQIGYTTGQNASTFGTCDPAARVIRISDRLLKMPRFVHDYVVVHELAHLKVPRHGPAFWQLVNRYPRTERARGYLMASGLRD
jgi:predicted metal-dependent hydrolase